MIARRRWLFADQLGPHFRDRADSPVLLIEARSVFRRRRFHRQKAHLVLSALRHSAAELGAAVDFRQTHTYAEALAGVRTPLDVCSPTSYAAVRFVTDRPGVTVLPARGFVTSREDFTRWANGRSGRLLLEDFYRDARRRVDVLMDGSEPAGGRWNYDHDNRQPPPKSATLGAPAPWRAVEDDIDAEVRADLDRWEREGSASFVGDDGPRWAPATRTEAVAALNRFLEARLPTFGPTEDSMLAADPVMSHSVLSPALNLGLLDPLECIRAAEEAYRRGAAPLASVEGYVRQLLGWRDYVWHLYWHTGPAYRARNALTATTPVPDWLWDLDADAVQARCLRTVLHRVRTWGWTHHIERLMVLGNYGLQRGLNPAELTAWFHTSFLDGYDWVMLPNVVGMSQYADGGLMATKPYAAGGAYLDRMSDFCGSCNYRPRIRIGPRACPYTAGYWAFLDRNEERLGSNPRLRRPLAGLRRLPDRAAVVAQETFRGTDPG